MHSILVVTKAQDTLRTFHSCFQSQYIVAKAADKNSALDMLKKRRYDFIFFDFDGTESGVLENHDTTP